MDDDEWNDMDFRAKATINLCLSDEVLYNVMNETMTAGLWCKLKSLYMTKSLSNKLFWKKQLYRLLMKEGTLILHHLNSFNRIMSDLLALDVKLEEEDKAILLLCSLPFSYDHLATTIMYRKETLLLEDVRQVLQNNALMKRAYPQEEASGLVVKENKGRSKRIGSGQDSGASSGVTCFWCKNTGHMKKS